jgi:hypothetical protein
VLAPSLFQLVSLQNCSLKTICKTLISWLHAWPGISPNIVYATEIVQWCHKRKAPVVVLKLDFAKAFDSIDWCSLHVLLKARGFPSKWCD